MRQFVLPPALHLLILLAGAGVLRLAGARARSAGHAVAMVGLAYLLGMAAVFATLQLLLVVGVPFALPTIAIVGAAFATPAVLAAPKSIRAFAAMTTRRTLFSPLVAFGIVAGIAWVYALVALSTLPLIGWDAWGIWSYKGAIMFRLEQIPVETFQAPALTFVHYDYPLLLPLWEAAHFRAVGAADTSQVTSISWILLPAWVGGAIALAPRNAPPLVVHPLVWGTAALLIALLLTCYADVPVAMFLGLGVLALGRWLQDRNVADLIVGTVLLGGAAGIKNEGMIGALLIFAALALVLVREPRALRTVILAGTAWLAAFVLPWKLWLAVHDIHGDLPLGRVVDVKYLVDHLDRLDPIWRSLTGQVATGDQSTIILITIVVLALARGATPRIRAFCALTFGLYLASLVIAYWTTPYDVIWHLDTSSQRVLLSLALIGVSIILLVSSPSTPPTAVEEAEVGAQADTGAATTRVPVAS